MVMNRKEMIKNKFDSLKSDFKDIKNLNLTDNKKNFIIGLNIKNFNNCNESQIMNNVNYNNENLNTIREKEYVKAGMVIKNRQNNLYKNYLKEKSNINAINPIQKIKVENNNKKEKSKKVNFSKVNNIISSTYIDYINLFGFA